MARIKDTQAKGYILAENDKPFASEAAADAVLEEMKLDPAKHSIVKFEGGFAIISDDEDKSAAKPVDPTVVTVPKERYFRVLFSEKSDPQQEDRVILSVNGDILVAQRGKEIVIPERYTVAADNAQYPKYRQLPGEKRKVTSWIQTYPYQKLGEATKEEYDRMKAEGTKKTKDFVEAESRGNML